MRAGADATEKITEKITEKVSPEETQRVPEQWRSSGEVTGEQAGFHL